jgi:hydrogenase maturation protease
VGQRLRGDDGAGSVLAARLAARLADEHLLILDAGHAPENCLGPVVRFRPDAILFADIACVEGGHEAAPGDLIWLPAAEAGALGGSTHSLPLATLAAYLTAETGAPAYVLGIAPGDLRFAEGLSPDVEQAVERGAAAFVAYWRKLSTACSAMASGEASLVST